MVLVRPALLCVFAWSLILAKTDGSSEQTIEKRMLPYLIKRLTSHNIPEREDLNDVNSSPLESWRNDVRPSMPRLARRTSMPYGNYPPREIRSEDYSEETGLDCLAPDWFVLLDDMPACVKPMWEIGYDPTYCAKLRSNDVYCNCVDYDMVQELKDTVQTCVPKNDLQKDGRCYLNPCPPTYNCIDEKPGSEFQCIKDNVKVPMWYVPA